LDGREFGIASGDIRSIVKLGSVLYAGDQGGGGVFQSTNDGASWSATGTDGPSMRVRTLLVSGSNLFAGEESGRVHRSTDGGSTWTLKNTGISSNYVKALVQIGDVDLCRNRRGWSIPHGQ